MLDDRPSAAVTASANLQTIGTRMLIRTRMAIWLTALAACSISAGAVVSAPAAAKLDEPESALQIVAEDQQEAAAETVEAAREQAEVAAAQAEDLALSHASPSSSKAAQEYPALWGRIAKIKAIIAKLEAEKLALRELPQRSKRRKDFLPRKHARIQEERQRLWDVHRKIRAKKLAAT